MTIIQLFNSAKAGIGIIKLLSIFFENNSSILREIAGIHFQSAKQSFNAVENLKNTNDKHAELRVCIGHLRDSYNSLIFYTYRKETYLLFFTRETDIEEKENALMEAVNIAVLISITYAEIDRNMSNALIWKKNALNCFSEYKPIYSKYIEPQCYTKKTVHYGGPVSYGGGSYEEDVFSNELFKEKLLKLNEKETALHSIFNRKAIS